MIYAMSDIHGMYGSFMRRIKQLDNLKSVKAGKDKLILLGDYIDVGNNSFKVLKTIYELQQDAGKENMIVLMGNHDKWFIDFLDGKYDDWIYGTDSFSVLGSFIDDTFTDKYPATKGNFYMDIIAGHVSTSTASGQKNRHDIYYDGKSHFLLMVLTLIRNWSKMMTG